VRPFFCLALSNPENWPIAETAQVVVCVLLKYSSREASKEPASQLVAGELVIITWKRQHGQSFT